MAGRGLQEARCLICSTKMKTGRHLDQDCTKRSVLYETWCMTCAARKEARITVEVEDEEEQKRQIRNMKLHKYVGESARSAYERGLEHQNDMEDMKKDSHMLKHFFSHHEGEELGSMEFGMRIIRTHRSAFNRQISESVEIQNQKKIHHILNSKSEYNRCALPRLTAKMGEENFKQMDKARQAEKLEERNLERKIADMKERRKRSKTQRGEKNQELQNNQQEREENSINISIKEYSRKRKKQRKGRGWKRNRGKQKKEGRSTPHSTACSPRREGRMSQQK